MQVGCIQEKLTRSYIYLWNNGEGKRKISQESKKQSKHSTAIENDGISESTLRKRLKEGTIHLHR